MKKSIVNFASRLAAISTLLAFGTTSALGQDNRPAFSVVFVSQIGSDSQKAQLLATATRNRTAAVQDLLASDHRLASALRGMGIQLRNVIRGDRAIDGHYVFYVR